MIFKHLLTALPAIILPVFIYAQKLPNVQQKSLLAPQEIKIDGKATEWNNQFQAYNHAADIFYTISNDDKNLYLTVQATDHTIINKILGGGIVFTINTSDEKNIKRGISLTYPVLDMHNRVWVNLNAEPEAGAGPAVVVKWADSIMNVKNREFVNKSKVIGVNGIKGLDSLISVYNHDGIKSGASFNNKLAFTYELSIDLKKLGLSTNNPIRFAYNITLPGVNMAAVYAASGEATAVTEQGYVIPVGTLPGFSEEYFEKNQPSLPHKVHQVVFINSTDFWGEYTLAKK
ncbi:MAG: hypothetical protein JWP78_2619 [Mucilaginibacter sp.]|nr:hypothetical protein [Mucilaginibacter sp.]